MPDLVLSGRFEPAEERRYRHLPFMVPPGTTQIHLRCEYSHPIASDPLLRGGNTLDLGLFDERGSESGGPGFRGWSGSNKLAITIDEAWATPPYRPGPIGDGEWQVLLGPYKVGPEGLEYRLDIWFNLRLVVPDPPPPIPHSAARSRRTEPMEPGWLRGDLHCHTLASDGDSPLADVLARAAETGLDFLGVTDHNAALLPNQTGGGDGSPILLPGIEVTTYGGHWNVWGGGRWFDFRTADRNAVAEQMAVAAASGGFVSVNHPRPFGPAWAYGMDLGYHAIEVWNGPWPLLNSVSVAFWDVHLRRGQRIVAVGGSDTHHLRGEPAGPFPRPRLGEPTTWVQVDGAASAAAILASLRAGRSFISASPDGPQLYLSREEEGVRLRVGEGQGLALMLIGAAGCVAAKAIDREEWTGSFPFPPANAYLRAQLVDDQGNIAALTNALWR